MISATDAPEGAARGKTNVSDATTGASMSDDTRRRAMALRQSGMSWSDIASTVGVPSSTVRNWGSRESRRAARDAARVRLAEREAKKFSKMRKREIAATAAPDIAPTVPTAPTKQTLNQSIEDLSTLVKSLLARDSLATAERLANTHAIPQTLDDEHTRETVMEKLAKRSAAILGWESTSQTVQVQVGVLASLPDRPEN